MRNCDDKFFLLKAVHICFVHWFCLCWKVIHIRVIHTYCIQIIFHVTSFKIKYIFLKKVSILFAKKRKVQPGELKCPLDWLSGWSLISEAENKLKERSVSQPSTQQYAQYWQATAELELTESTVKNCKKTITRSESARTWIVRPLFYRFMRFFIE